jgi:exodeoxyribonuclease VII small subunit
MPSKSSAAANKEAEQTFESSLGRLEQIVEEMEADRLPLEDLLQRYEEGTRLVKVCQDKIEAAERRIEIITRGASGKPQLTAFEPAAPSSTAPVTPKAAPGANQDVSLF